MQIEMYGGRRYIFLRSQAFIFLNEGHTMEKCREMLEHQNEGFCEPLLEVEEVHRILKEVQDEDLTNERRSTTLNKEQQTIHTSNTGD